MTDFIMAYMADSREENEHRTFLLRKYLLLHSQQETLRRRLSTASSVSSPSSPRSPSVDTAPSFPVDTSARSPISTEAASPTGESNAEHEQLRVVNQQLKTLLTDLLNSDTAKQDASFRLWVQGRLMDAEMELKRQRRRMSSVNVDFADSFRLSLQHSQSSPV